MDTDYPKINYVIASWAGKKGLAFRKLLQSFLPHPQNYMRAHLNQLSKVKHSLSQITIMKAHVNNNEEFWDDYYKDIEKYHFPCKVEIIECPNQGISYGQHLYAFEKYRDEFDYYIFIEDDYTVAIDNFDKILFQIYQNTFPNDIGFLCSWVSKKPLHAAFEFGLLSSKTLNEMYSNIHIPYQILANTPNNKCQVKFSNFFVGSGIPLKDFSHLYSTPYFISNSKRKIVNCSKTPHYPNKCIFIPLQAIGMTGEQISETPKHGLL